MHAHSYLQSSIKILGEYRGEEPLASFLKKYFGRYKKYGSRDRKQVSHLCYCYFRQGRALLDLPIEERIMTGLFLSSSHSNEILEQLKPGWNKKIKLPVPEKLLIINSSLLMDSVFPWKEGLSKGIDHEKFCESFFIQPELFLRLRPGLESMVKTKLQDHGINFSEISSTCLSLPNASKIESIIELDKETVVQDLNSQQTGNFFKDLKPGDSRHKLKVWDCCAGSGGKSLMLYDIDPNIDLTVSDIRESILTNLNKRFTRAGIKKYRSFAADLSQANFKIQNSPKESLRTNFELILCDAPCTGSGTWSRTPEQLYFFDEKKIEQYAVLQKKIVSNIIPQLNREGYLMYITCSVFKKENEDVVEFIRANSELELIKIVLLEGYEKKADTMFVAVFKKRS